MTPKNELRILKVNLEISILRIMYIRALVGGYLRKYPVGKRNLEIYRLLQSEKLFKQSILSATSIYIEFRFFLQLLISYSTFVWFEEKISVAFHFFKEKRNDKY